MYQFLLVRGFAEKKALRYFTKAPSTRHPASSLQPAAGGHPGPAKVESALAKYLSPFFSANFVSGRLSFKFRRV